jgi:hypothetical protein
MKGTEMTITETKVSEKVEAPVLPDQQSDAVLSAKEQDAIIQVAAAEQELATVPGSQEGERRAWGEPRAGRSPLSRD